MLRLALACALMASAACEAQFAVDPWGEDAPAEWRTVPPEFALMLHEGVRLDQVRLMAAGYSTDDARFLAERCDVQSSFNVAREWPYLIERITCQEDFLWPAHLTFPPSP